MLLPKNQDIFSSSDIFYVKIMRKYVKALEKL